MISINPARIIGWKSLSTLELVLWCRWVGLEVGVEVNQSHGHNIQIFHRFYKRKWRGQKAKWISRIIVIYFKFIKRWQVLGDLIHYPGVLNSCRLTAGTAREEDKVVVGIIKEIIARWISIRISSRKVEWEIQCPI